MIREFKEGIDCINSLCENFPRFTTFVSEEKVESDEIFGGVCRLFLKDETGKYTIPTPFFGFWSGCFNGTYERKTTNGSITEEYFELAAAGDCIHNFVICCYGSEGVSDAKFCEAIETRSRHRYCCKSSKIFSVGFDGKPIYPDIIFSDFIYSTIFGFGKEGWERFFEIVGKYVFLSSPTWGIVEQNGKFSNRVGTEFVEIKHIVENLKKIFKTGNIILNNDKSFNENFEGMCNECLLCKCPEKSLDKLGEWLVSKGYQLNEIEKLYCQVDGFGYDGEMRFERGFGYDFAEIAFALLRKGDKR